MNNLTNRIRWHYNLLAPFYYGLWGQHVHHGFWTDANDMTPPARAQDRLIHELYTFAGQPHCTMLLDIGCGYGGSLIWFARNTGTHGRGITLSQSQRLIGQLKIFRQGLHKRLRIQVADAQRQWPVTAAYADLVWCVECSEHLADRLHFAREAYRVLRPGGTLCVAAWLAGLNTSPEAEALRQAVEQGMLCYPFGTCQDYIQWFYDAGFEAAQSRIITPHVLHTWDICITLRDRPALSRMATLLGGDVQAFTESFTTLRQAYIEGAMEYGLFFAHKAA